MIAPSELLVENLLAWTDGVKSEESKAVGKCYAHEKGCGELSGKSTSGTSPSLQALSSRLSFSHAEFFWGLFRFEINI